MSADRGPAPGAARARDFAPSELVVLRTPMLPFEEIESWSAGLSAPASDGGALAGALAHDRELLRERLRALVERPEVAEALFLASPDLSQSLAHWLREPESKKGQRTEQGLVRYFLRMASRPTPFGLFSGCTAGTVGERTRFELAATAAYRRHSRLDMDYLFALCEQLTASPEARRELSYLPNPTLYRAAGRLRYAEARLAGRLRTYHLVAVEAFAALEATLELAASGARVDDLARALVAADPDGEVSFDEAQAFILDLVDNQLLLPELALPVTGEESTPELLRQLPGCAFAREASERLSGAEWELAGIDAAPLGCEAERYREVARRLEPLGVPVELSRLFQVDLVKPATEVSLGPEVIAEVLRGVDLFHRLVPAAGGGNLSDFRDAFRERYGEGREIALLAALDEESGIGFERSGLAAAEASPLLGGMPFRLRNERSGTAWTRGDALLLRLLTEALAAGRQEIEVSAAELGELAAGEPPPLPDSFALIAAVAARSAEALAGGEFRLLLSRGGGPSGARLLGRFCHADEAIHAGVRAHLEAEEALRPEAIYAELVHLPAGRIGNVLSRPVLRGYEIPFLGRSGAPAERQIPVSDLVVTVVGDTIHLRSKRLGREVIPRLTTAHNTARESLGVYRFLAALQNQGRVAGFGWSWGPLEAAPFLPRVASGRLVLCRARWRLFEDEIQRLASATGAERFERARSWRRERRLPRLVVLADGDNELLLDFDNALSLDSVIELVKGRDEAVLTELFPGSEELCARGPEGRFCQELVIPFVRRPRAEQGPAPRPREARQEPRPRLSPAAARRSFAPGSEWLFAKLFTGTGTADRVLCEAVAPLIEAALRSGAARRWFFLRYSDPAWHLRLRIRGEAGRLRAEVLPDLSATVEALLEDGAAWKLQLDTYEREVERYGGGEAVEVAEEIFFHDSQAAVAILQSLAGDAGADLRWRLTLAGMDRLLEDFGYGLEARLRMAANACANFASRYDAELLRPPLAEKVRRERAALERLLAAGGNGQPELRPAMEALDRRSRELAPLVEKLRHLERRGHLRQPLGEIVPSFLHMFVNRMSRAHGPEHELVLYDLLAQLYGSRLARERKGRQATERAAAGELVAGGVG